MASSASGPPAAAFTQSRNLPPYLSNLNSPTPDTVSISAFVLGFTMHMETSVLSENTI